MSQEIIEALKFAIAEKERRADYWKKQLMEIEPEIKKLKATLASVIKKTPPLTDNPNNLSH